MLQKMRRYLGIGAAWLGATVLSVVIASAAVAGIRDRVVEAPVAIGLPTSTTTATGAGASTETSSPSATTSTTLEPTSTTSAELPETSTTITTTTQASAETTTTTTTTTAAATTTTTTAPPTTTTTASVTYSTHDLVGGTVVLAFGNGQVNLVSATPRPGFSVDPEHTGPKEVEVEFVSNDHRSELSAHVESGELKVEIEEESGGDEDD